MPYKRKEDKAKQMREWRKRNKERLRQMRENRAKQKEKIAELKHLASQPITISSAVELAEKIKEL